MAFIIVGSDVGREKLDRHQAFELRILGFVDDAHAAFAELGEDFVVGDGFADHTVIYFNKKLDCFYS